MRRRTADVWFTRLFVSAAFVLLGGFGYALMHMNAGAFTRSSDIRIDQPEVTVRDARSLIAMKNQNPGAFGDFTEPEKLPASLRIHGLRYAKVHADHVDLVVARSPDVSIGTRIWAMSHRTNHDETTRYAGIYFFRYDHESPQSESNIP
jgi:hypothetical protein